MSTTLSTPSVSPVADAFGDLRLVLRQLHYEQLTFWRNRVGAVFTVGFSVIFLVLLAAGGGNKPDAALGGLPLIQYYVPGFAAYGVMSACYSNLAIVLVVRRETGLLKRLRLSPIPTWVLLGAVMLNAAVVAVVEVALLLLIGRYGYSVVLPAHWVPFVIAVAVGIVGFTAIGIAASTLVPSEEAAGPMISLVYFVLLFLSGLWFPLSSGSALAKISNYFPIHHLIVAFYAPFDRLPGSSPWAWHDLLVIGIWGVGAIVIALRNFSWEPHRH